ncbi:MAG: hypothetical protein GY936_20030 [Ignavibacteriae bacterium]|nr:hypothetical protein [Ignavibacteriota bacterium]
MIRLKKYTYFLIAISMLLSIHGFGQKYHSAWTERGASNRIDSLLIEIDNRKVTFSIPKENGSVLVFVGRMNTTFNAEPQDLYAYAKNIPNNINVSPEYLQILKEHPPKLLCHIKKGDDTIEFLDNKVEFQAPEKKPESVLRPENYPYFKKNRFVVDSTWLKKSKKFEMRDLLDSDSHYGVGMLCGFTDGFLEDVKMVISIAEVIDENTLFFIGDMQLFDQYSGAKSFVEEYGLYLPKEFGPEATAARAKQREIALAVGQYLSDYEKLSEFGRLMYNQLAEMMSEWFEEFVGENTSALQGYQHGKGLYGFITMFIGVKEISVLLKGGQAGFDMLSFVRKMSCFTGETPVITENGAIPISELKLGLTQFKELNSH